MIAMSALRTAMFAWVGTIGVTAGSPPSFRALPVVMANEKLASAFVDPLVGARAYLNVVSVRPLGVDEIRTIDAEIADRPVRIPEVNGLREVTVSVRVDSYTQDIDLNAWVWAEKLRTRLKLPRVEALFQTAGIAIVEAHPLTDITNKFDERVFSRASFDVVFAMPAVDAGNITDDAIETIGAVEISSDTVTNVDGAATPVQVGTTVGRYHVAQYELDESAGPTVADSTGRGHAGTVSGSVVYETEINDETGITFEGGLVTIANHADFNNPAIGIDATVAWDGSNTYLQRIVEKSIDGAVGVRSCFGLCITNSGLPHFEINNADLTQFSVEGSTPITEGEVVALSARYDGAALKLYVDGVLVGTALATGDIAISDKDVSIGGQLERTRPFNGTIFDLTIWNQG